MYWQANLMLLLLVFAAPSHAAIPSARETVNFDFAWRFQQAAEPRYQQCTFEQNVNYGVGYIWSGVTATKEDCCNECVNRDTCRAWDWNGHFCWVKVRDPRAPDLYTRQIYTTQPACAW